MSLLRTSLIIAASIGAVVTTACSLTKKDDDAPPPAAATARSYSATASVGDFMTITINPTSSTAGTIDYNNVSTAESGTVPYTIGNDGSYAITDPQGVLVTAWEIPGYALVATSNHSGPNHEPSLVTAIATTSIAKSDIAGKNSNYIQFRTNSGGMELGWTNVQSDGSILHQGYWPYGVQNGGNAFHAPDTFDGAGMEAVPSMHALRLLTDPPNGYSYIFRTTGGFMAVDTGNGGLVCIQQAASKAFDAANAGTYNAMIYRKVNVTTNNQNVEVGTPSLGKATVTLTADGHVTVVSEDNTTLASNTLLVPIEDTPALYDGGGVNTTKLKDPCHGLFTFQVTSNGVTQDVYVGFLDRALLLSSFSTAVGATGSTPYSYFYGVALKTTPTAPISRN